MIRLKVYTSLGARHRGSEPCRTCRCPFDPTNVVSLTGRVLSNLSRFGGRALRLPLRPAERPGRPVQAVRAVKGSDPEVKRRIMTGTYVLSAGYFDAYYLKAQKVAA